MTLVTQQSYNLDQKFDSSRKKSFQEQDSEKTVNKTQQFAEETGHLTNELGEQQFQPE